jgi:zinc transport system permease protein
MCIRDSLLALSFDPEFARTRGVPVTVLHYLLLAMIAVSVVMIIRVVGLILVIALLTIPPYLAERKAGSLAGMMLLSVALSLAFCLSGLALSYHFNLSSGASIIAVASLFFFLAAGRDMLASKSR